MALLLDRPYDSLFASFQNEQETPYRDDDSVMPRETILDDIHRVEDRFANLMLSAIEQEAKALVSRNLEAIRKGDLQAIENAPSYAANALGPIIYTLWQEGWALGWAHALKEIEILNQQSTFSEIAISGNVEFADLPEGAKRKRKPSWDKYIRKPKYPAYGEPVKMEDSAMRAAIEMRTVRVGQDLDAQARDEIRQHMRDAASGPIEVMGRGEGGEMLLKKRISEKEMNRRIQVSLGRQMQRDGATREEVTQIQKSGGFKNRAKVIAVTEMMGSYSLARLSAFKAMGIRRVRWQTFEPPVNVCQTCWSRNGTVHEIDDLLGAGSRGLSGNQKFPTTPGGPGYDPRQYIIPAHPSCRCHWAPIGEGDRDKIDDPGRDPRRRKAFPLKGVWAGLAAGALGLAALYLVLGQNVGAKLTRTQQMMMRLNNLRKDAQPVVDEATGLVGSELLEQAIDQAGAPGPGREQDTEPKPEQEAKSPVDVGGVDLNRATEKTLRSRFGLTQEQSEALAQSIRERPATDLFDLAERIRNGEIEGVDLNTWEAQVMTKYTPPEPLDLPLRLPPRKTPLNLPPKTPLDLRPRPQSDPITASQSNIIPTSDLFPDLMSTSDGSSDWQQSPTDLAEMLNWPFLGKMSASEDRALLQSQYKKIADRLRTVFPTYPDERGMPPETRELAKSMRIQLGRISNLKGRIDLQTATIRSHTKILESYGYQVTLSRNPANRKVQGVRLEEPDGGVQLTPAKQRRVNIALSNLTSAYNSRTELSLKLFDDVKALEKTDEALRLNLLRHGSAGQPSPDPITALPPPENLSTPADSPAYPLDLRPRPTPPAPPPPAPEGDLAVRPTSPESLENEAWQLQRDVLISEGAYNSSAAEYKTFDQLIKNATPAQTKAWMAIRKAEKVKGSKVAFAHSQFPKMTQRDYREAARLIGAIEDALNVASTQKFVIAYSDALIAKTKAEYLAQKYPEFREFLAQKYPSVDIFARMARTFNVLAPPPVYNPDYFSDYAKKRWHDIGKTIEDDWRRQYRLGEVSAPEPIAPRPRIAAPPPAPIGPIQPEAPSMTNIIPPEAPPPAPITPAPGPNLAFEPRDIETLDDLKDTIEALVGQRPKSLKEARQLFDRYVNRNSTGYPDTVPYQAIDSTEEYDNGDGETMWDDLFDMEDGRFLIIPGAYDGGHSGDGFILPIAGRELFDYFYKRGGPKLKASRKPRASRSLAQAEAVVPPVESASLPAPSPKPVGELDRSRVSAPGTDMRADALSRILEDITAAKTSVTSFAAQKRWAQMSGLIDRTGQLTLEGSLVRELDPYLHSNTTATLMVMNMARQNDAMAWLLQQLADRPGNLSPIGLAYEYNPDLYKPEAIKVQKVFSRLFRALDQATPSDVSPISRLRIFETNSNGGFTRDGNLAENPYLIAYALAKVWEDNQFTTIQLHEQMIGTKLGAMLGIKIDERTITRTGDSDLYETLALAQVYDLAEQWLTVPPFQIVPRWGSLDELIRNAYEWEEERRNRGQFYAPDNLVTFTRRWRPKYG